MKLWRVDDVMTREVVSVDADIPYRDLVELLISRRGSTVPGCHSPRRPAACTMLNGSDRGTPFGVA